MNYSLKKELKLEGVGYKLDYIERAAPEDLLQTKRYLIITLGYAHPISVLIPFEIKYVNVKNTYGIVELGSNTSSVEKRAMSQFIATLIEITKKAISKSGKNSRSGQKGQKTNTTGIKGNATGSLGGFTGFIVRNTWST